ncbi:hypothetical protein AeMF1_017574 [Aphanomyces euteiches]|nr:hypothetical protein AeMF1_017574 [Aphanomyces euteiches]KAH9190423.1 hypothetical protein AeNC1_007607 [Aphanomyces euteiches]
MGCQNNIRVNGLCHAHSKHRPAIKCRSKSRTGPYCLRHIHCNKTRPPINAPTAQLGSPLSVISFPSTSVDNEHESYALDPTGCFDYTSMIDQLDLSSDAVEDCRQVHSYDSTDEKADREAADKAQYAHDIDELVALLHEGQFDP